MPTKDDLPAVRITALRKAGVVRPGMDEVQIKYGEGDDALYRTVKLKHTSFSSGGGWSYFVCPQCEGRTPVLRLLDGKPVCRKCDGLLYRSNLNPARINHRWRVERAAKLEAMLQGPVSRRKRMQEALRWLTIKIERTRLARAQKALKPDRR